jgi:hypothetical protein
MGCDTTSRSTKKHTLTFFLLRTYNLELKTGLLAAKNQAGNVIRLPGGAHKLIHAFHQKS